MAFLEQRIPDTVSRGTKGGPRGRRTKVYVQNGRLRQVFEWSRSLQQYDVSYGIRTLADLEAVRALFYVVMFTPFEGFRFKDWNDYRMTQSTSRLDFVSGTEWQIKRLYTVGASTHARTITKPVSGSVTVYRTRSGVVTTATASVDSTTGLATIAGHAGGDTYTCAGEFDVPVTFADDALDQIELDGNLDQMLQGLPAVMLEELAA